jgi:transketolase
MTNKELKQLEDLKGDFIYWEKTKDVIDQFIDLILNYRQSGHPGGSRSKAHILLSLMLSGAMRWDIRHPDKKFADRFVLSAGHTVPLIYCTLAVLNEAMRVKYEKTGNAKYLVDKAETQALYWEDLLSFRRRGGLSGHSEMVEKSLFIKFNTGPSGHGSPAAAGEALALKRAGAGDVKVFALEGEAGLTPGAVHETMNSAWGLNLDNLVLLVDWNDYGIDKHRVSDVVYGTPNDWIGSHGWHVVGTNEGSEWATVTDVLLRVTGEDFEDDKPRAGWFKTRKGRGYLKFDNFSHGSPHGMNSEIFWETKKPYVEKYGAEFRNFLGEAPEREEAIREEFSANLQAAIKILQDDKELVDYLADRLVAIGESVPESVGTFKLGDGKKTPFTDERLYDSKNYPDDLFEKPGAKAANRAGLRKWGSWANAFGAKEYGRPVFIASSADLAGSTNIAGFAEGYGDFKGYGWYALEGSEDGALLPQEITEFANSGIMAGLSATNLATDPEQDFEGFWGTSSTYGSFSYLKYGMMRLYSQMAQDNPWKMGKVLWIAGHSGPETADDSRTHFGIFSPGVTQLFPKGSVINMHPWEHNEVPVMLGAALALDVPLVALHLTRPSIEIPDRVKLGIPSHFEAAKGAYIVRDYQTACPKGGTVFVQGTSAMANVCEILPELSKLNMKIVYVSSTELFNRQPAAYQEKVVTSYDKVNSTVITTQTPLLMQDWLFYKANSPYALSADWDNNWRSGGTLDEVIDEARLSPEWILKGLRKFTEEQDIRLKRIRDEVKTLDNN